MHASVRHPITRLQVVWILLFVVFLHAVAFLVVTRSNWYSAQLSPLLFNPVADNKFPSVSSTPAVPTAHPIAISPVEDKVLSVQPVQVEPTPNTSTNSPSALSTYPAIASKSQPKKTAESAKLLSPKPAVEVSQQGEFQVHAGLPHNVASNPNEAQSQVDAVKKRAGWEQREILYRIAARNRARYNRPNNQIQESLQ